MSGFIHWCGFQGFDCSDVIGDGYSLYTALIIGYAYCHLVMVVLLLNCEIKHINN